MTTETKGTVLLKTASELKSFSKGEESMIEEVAPHTHNNNNNNNNNNRLPRAASEGAVWAGCEGGRVGRQDGRDGPAFSQPVQDHGRQVTIVSTSLKHILYMNMYNYDGQNSSLTHTHTHTHMK